ncbi:MAG: T9SS type A sorting domain-containing protein [Candidatus Cloacimonetes bacterium]|nr:T9SS type A sorting domain-containing protein [Candidatus Cloacimonadota bacterium]
MYRQFCAVILIGFWSGLNCLSVWQNDVLAANYPNYFLNPSSTQRMAPTSDNGIIYVFEQAADFGNRARVQRLNSDGEQVWSEPLMFPDSLYAAYSAAICRTSDNNYVVVWTSDLYEFNAQKINEAGQILWSNACEMYVSRVYSPYKIIPDNQGGIYLIVGDMPGNRIIRAFHVGSDGSAIWGGFGLDVSEPNGDAFINEMDALVLSDGTLLISYCWSNISGSTLRIKRFDSQGSQVWNQYLSPINASNSGQYNSKLNHTGVNSFVVSWLSRTSTDSTSLSSMRYNYNGEPVWSFPISIVSEQNIQKLQTVQSDSTSYLVSWLTNSQIFTRKLNSQGIHAWTSTPVITGNGTTNLQKFQMISNNQGGAVFIWESTDSDIMQLYAQHISSDGVLQITGNLLLFSASESTQMYLPYCALCTDYIYVYYLKNSFEQSSIRLHKLSFGGFLYYGWEGLVLHSGLNGYIYDYAFSSHNGKLLVSWTDWIPNQQQLLYRIVWPDGSLEDEILLADYTTTYGYMCNVLSCASAGDYTLVLWQVPDVSQRLMMQMIGPGGLPLWQNGGVMLGVNVSYGLATSDSSSIYLYWEDVTTAGKRIFMRRYPNNQTDWDTPVYPVSESLPEYYGYNYNLIACEGRSVIWRINTSNGSRIMAIRLNQSCNAEQGWPIYGYPIGQIDPPYIHQNCTYLKTCNQGMYIRWANYYTYMDQYGYEQTVNQYKNAYVPNPNPDGVFPEIINLPGGIADLKDGIYIFSNSVRKYEYDGTLLWTANLGGVYPLAFYYFSSGAGVCFYLDYLILNYKYVDSVGNVILPTDYSPEGVGYEWSISTAALENNIYVASWKPYLIRVRKFNLEPVSAQDEILPSPSSICNLKILPNPNYGKAEIHFNLPQELYCSFDVFNVKGQLVQRQDLGLLKKGSQQWVWDNKDQEGKAISTGVYLIRLKTGNRFHTSKLLLLR